jgi:hypothetical protein
MLKISKPHEFTDFFNILSKSIIDGNLNKQFIHYDLTNGSFDAYGFDYKEENNRFMNKSLDLIRGLFKSKIDIYEFLTDFLPLIEQICQDFHESLYIKKEKMFEENGFDVKSNNEAFAILLNSLQDNTFLNIYYHCDKIHRFKLRPLPLDDSIDMVRNYFHNLRALFANIAMRHFELIYFTLYHAGDTLLAKGIDFYRGKLVSLDVPKLSHHVNSTTDLQSLIPTVLDRVKIDIKDSPVLNTDIEVMNWIEYIIHIIPWLRKLSESLSDQFELICMATFASFRKNLMCKSELSKISHTVLEECVLDSLSVAYAAIDFDKKANELELYNYFILYNHYLVQPGIIKALQTTLTEKLITLVNRSECLARFEKYSAMKEGFIKNKIKQEVGEWRAKDIRKLKKVIELIDVLPWMRDSLRNVTLIYETAYVNLKKINDLLLI